MGSSHETFRRYQHSFSDTSILLDILENRGQHYEYSSQIWTLAASGRAQVFISAISFNNVFYLVRKHAACEKTQQALGLLNATFTMLPLSQDIVNPNDFSISML